LLPVAARGQSSGESPPAANVAPALGGHPALFPGVASAKEYVVMTPPLEGVLLELGVREGDGVRRGDVLAVIDNRVALASVKAAEAAVGRQAALERAQADLRMAETLVARVREARRREAASALELDQAESGLAQAQAALALAREQQGEARLQLELERARLESHFLRAPFDGQILRVDGQVGQAVQRSSPLLTLANRQTLRVELYLPVAWYEQVALGHDYLLDAGPPVDEPVRGVLTYREEAVDAATKTFRCTFEIDNREERFPAGFSVTLDPKVQAELSRPTGARKRPLGSLTHRLDGPARHPAPSVE
jgi:RND family efflux transporter MFP subunit